MEELLAAKQREPFLPGGGGGVGAGQGPARVVSVQPGCVPQRLGLDTGRSAERVCLTEGSRLGSICALRHPPSPGKKTKMFAVLSWGSELLPFDVFLCGEGLRAQALGHHFLPDSPALAGRGASCHCLCEASARSLSHRRADASDRTSAQQHLHTLPSPHTCWPPGLPEAQDRGPRQGRGSSPSPAEASLILPAGTWAAAARGLGL